MAVAQMAPGEGPGRRPMGEGEHEWGEHRGEHGMMMRMMEASRGARFHVSRGDSVVDIRCAAGEPMKACVDAASALLDKVGPPAGAVGH
ncbi:MAG: hypothetical protein NVSMB18_29060 [Acetobacteraceae bacterium]